MSFYKNVNVIPEFQFHHEYPVGTILSYRDRFIIEVVDAEKEHVSWNCNSCKDLCLLHEYCSKSKAIMDEVRCASYFRKDRRAIYYKEIKKVTDF